MSQFLVLLIYRVAVDVLDLNLEQLQMIMFGSVVDCCCICAYV